MRIKLAVIVKDKNYLSRICSALDTMFADRLETYYFSDVDLAFDNIRKGVKYNIMLADTCFEIDCGQLPRKTVLAYFCDSNDIETYKEKPCIGKYQKVDVIFREILRLYSENANDNVIFKVDDSSECSVVSVVSAAGGTGSSSVSAALAIRKQMSGMNTIYINLETFGSTNMFFNAAGEGDFSNIIFALKSKKSNLSFKLDSEVKRSQDGVAFFDECRIALDKDSLNFDECERLIDELIKKSSYDLIVVDMDFVLDEYHLSILNKSSKVIFISDGTDMANQKTEKAINAIAILESQKEDMNITEKSVLLYNKFSSKCGRQMDSFALETVGGINKLEGLDSYNLAKKISEYGVFDNI